MNFTSGFKYKEEKIMKVVFGCDPNAAEFKLELMEYVKGLGHEVEDLG